jgi:hypothetical protein
MMPRGAPDAYFSVPTDDVARLFTRYGLAAASILFFDYIDPGKSIEHLIDEIAELRRR